MCSHGTLTMQHLTSYEQQALKRLESQRAAARLAHGTSIRSAYAEDGRDVRVGSGLRGLHHAKSILLETPGGPELVAGSLNFTTSSKANAELGVKLSLPAGSDAAAAWLTRVADAAAESELHLTTSSWSSLMSASRNEASSRIQGGHEEQSEYHCSPFCLLSLLVKFANEGWEL